MSTLSAHLRYCCLLGRRNPQMLEHVARVAYFHLLKGRASILVLIFPVGGPNLSAELRPSIALKLALRALEIQNRRKHDDRKQPLALVRAQKP